MDLASSASSRSTDAAPGALDRLARKAAQGDVPAFEHLYRGTVARVHSIARRILGPARADEATQEVYLRAWRGISTWRGEAGVTTWLHRLALNVILDERAREMREVGTGEDLASKASGGSGETGLRLDLEAAIERLPDGARAVFVLHDVEGLRHEDIAERLEISAGTSKSQLHRARLLLRAALGSDHRHE